jgi:hypothetical protein
VLLTLKQEWEAAVILIVFDVVALPNLSVSVPE